MREKERKVAERMSILKEQGVPYIFVVWSGEGLPILDVMLKKWNFFFLLSKSLYLTVSCSQSVMARDCLFMIAGQDNKKQKLNLN